MQVETAIVSAITALIVSFVTSGLESRRKIDEDIRAERVQCYRELWEKTRLLPRWPPQRVTRRQLLDLSTQFRTWYFDGNGMYLSARSRAAYGRVQEKLNEMGRDSSEELLADQYEAVRRKLSDLRTSMTNDLQSRSQALGLRPNRNA